MIPAKQIFDDKGYMVFDDRLWRYNGGDSKTDNFYRKARVLRVYSEGRESLTAERHKSYKNEKLLADVVFEHDGRISRGHFVDAIMELL